MQILQLSLKIMQSLSFDLKEYKKSPNKEQTQHKKELSSLHQKTTAMIQMRQADCVEEDSNSKNIQLIMNFYSMVFSDQETQLKPQEIVNDENLPALKCARGILSQSDGGDVLDNALDKVVEDSTPQLGVKRKRIPTTFGGFNSQDPDELIRSVRRKRSNKSYYLTDLSIDGTDSPNFASMGVIENRANDSNMSSVSKSRYENQKIMQSQEVVPQFKILGNSQASNDAKMTPNGNYIRNIHKKQDKSKVHKYSPFSKQERDIQIKKRNKRKGFAKNTCGSNSFLAKPTTQTTRMAIKKGRSTKRKSKPTAFGPLALLSKASVELKIQSQEPFENKLQTCEEKTEPKQTQSPVKLEEIKEEITGNDSSRRDDEDRIMSPERRESEKILAYNTPTKSNLNSQMEENSEFDF